MNNTQLCLSIGIPSFLVVLAWLTSMIQTNRLADKIDRAIEQQHKDSLALQGYMILLHERMAI